MKLTFFLIAFSLVFVRAYFSLHGHDNKGKNNVTITIENGDDYEQIKYAGKIALADDETTFKSISPGGYVKFRKNTIKLAAESNITGEIKYTLYDDDQLLLPGDNSKRIIASAIKEMIAYGFDAQGRMERLYLKGGKTALINEINNIKDAGLVNMYMDRIFKSDTLSASDYSFIAEKIKSLNSDIDKLRFLKMYPIQSIQNPSVIQSWFDVAKRLNANIDKMNALTYLTESDSLSSECFDRILDISVHLNADIDKINMYQKLLNQKNISEQQWISLINQAPNITADVDKSNLLTAIAKQMPKTESIKSAWLKAARTINNNADYGNTLRAIEQF